ncbi:RNA methyltransferase [Pinibacter soli]|uniref:RNA methyltransferase n=1 Tax=Pinibacter soli TaxID=3044211 RepID=A0ABT6RGL5_9BACT|nr:RNA methyltransferase [Pinibacter soli]MDI3321688.1 RNA methyltransferase [Pinibacter soli]
MLVKSKAKYIQSLSQKKLRDEENVFVAEGPKIVHELLLCKNIQPVEVFAVQEWLDTNGGLVSGLKQDQVNVISESELERISFLSTPNKVLCLFKKPTFVDKDHQIILALDGIQDPGNLGTLVRIADWFGIEQVVCSKESADVFNPKVVQSTMASIARVEVVYTDLPDFIKDHASLGVYATLLNGQPIEKVGKIKSGIIVTGNESKGISEAIQQLATHKITIKRIGEAESLNAAVATGIVLSHVL